MTKQSQSYSQCRLIIKLNSPKSTNRMGTMECEKSDKASKYHDKTELTQHYRILRYTTAYCGILQNPTVYYSILRHTTAYYGILRHTTAYYGILRHTTVYYSILRYTTCYILRRYQKTSDRKPIRRCHPCLHKTVRPQASQKVT